MDEGEEDKVYSFGVVGISIGVGGGGGGVGTHEHLYAVGDAVHADGRVQGVVAVGAGVVGGGVAGGEGGVVGGEEGLVRAVGVMRELKRRGLRRDDIVGDGHLLWGREHPGLEVGSQLLEDGTGSVDDGEDAFGEAGGHVGDVAEAVREGRDAVGAVSGEGAFENVEADCAGVDD